MIEELDGVQEVFDLVQYSKKSENSGLAMEKVVEHIPCGSANKAVYAYRD